MITIKFHNNGIVEVEGIRFTSEVIAQALNDPPTDRLFSVKREGAQLIFTAYRTAENAAKFFNDNLNNERNAALGA